MKGDYYAILGVSPTSEDVVIRAAYRALMRRYHPDADPSSEATERARAINAAYAVLGDPEKRARYDGSLAAQGLIKPEAQPSKAMRAPSIRRPAPAVVAGLAFLAAAAGLILLSPPLAEMPGAPAVMGDPATSASTASARPRRTAASTDPGDACSAGAAADLVKREVFDRAARLRGADPAALAAIAERSFVRIDLAEARRAGDSGVLGCAGWLALDLPPGLVVGDGRSNLNSEIAFSLLPRGERGFRLAALDGAGALVRLLAEVERAPDPDRAADPEPIVGRTPERSPVPLTEDQQSRAPPTEPAADGSPTRLATIAATRAPPRNVASFDCGRAGTRAERAICSSRNLAGLDRQLGLFTSQSLLRADERRRAVLVSSAQRFEQRRNRCRSESCLTQAYVARMREVSDIMARRTGP